MWFRVLRSGRIRLRPLLGVGAARILICRAPNWERPKFSGSRPWTMSSVKASTVSNDLQEFSSFFERIAQDLTAEEWGHPEIGDAISRLREVLQYNTPGGKCNRGMTVLASIRELLGPTKLDEETTQRALVVGWCVELLQAFFLVADDMMDNSVTRRGHPCWYRKEGIGLDAINDSFLLESCIYRLLRKYCRDQGYYLNLLELFLETSYQTELGQALDLITAQPGKVDLARYTETRYKSIVKYKTAFYSFYLPVAAAMFMAGIDREEDHRNARTILLEMGEFFQIQENYGRDDADKVQRVKQLYEDLDLCAVYRQYEEESYQRLQILISQHANGLSKEIFLGLARKIYKRQK
ncbi:farnesyl pyrophosphate synthase isoform X4 [Mixophyes fleayi]|uniref:farnesyl pyrophosphate synthase isoform X4 n=1 Tax=Mixophyes fleayi TaxID=3061075 RepID=UPI003F4D885F